MLALAKLKMAAMVFLAVGLVGSAAGLAAAENSGTVTATLEMSKHPVVVEAGLTPDLKGPWTVPHVNKRNPAVFTGEPITFRVTLKYTGDKPSVGFVDPTSSWTFLFTPLDGGVPRKAVLSMTTSRFHQVAGRNPRSCPCSSRMERLEASRLFSIKAAHGGMSLRMRKIPAGQKKKPVLQLPAWKIQLDREPYSACQWTPEAG